MKKGKKNYNFPLISQQVKTPMYFGDIKSLHQGKQLLNGVKNYNKIVLEYEVTVNLNVTKSILFSSKF